MDSYYNAHEFAMVRSTMQQICDQERIALHLNLQPGFCRQCDCGMCTSSLLAIDGASLPAFRLIRISADPTQITPQSLWWTFCHELAHVLHGDVGAVPPIQEMSQEIRAWDTARTIASHSYWKPNAEFERQRRECLATYGVAA